MKFSNALIHESSPYLLQHAHNPVNWHPWNETTLQKAEQEQKLIIVSIGYSACHWCHVMERESFEDQEVAALMNTHFINIKVDREERPDIDQIYMDAVQLISGRGGWPLNAICLPDTRPVYAGTYFPKQHWMQVLKYFVHEYQHHRNNLYEQAENLTYHISILEKHSSDDHVAFTPADNDTAAATLLAEQDPEYGGRYGAPKFPMPVNYLFLLQHYFFSKNEKVLKAVTTLLDKMLMGGIYDQIGGGFARYSVDDHWEIPHFEKMLYDNAQLVSLYAQAFQLTKDPAYKRTVDETLEFVKRELTGAEGNFYSALDADSEGEEGKFYVWDYDELAAILGDDFLEFQKVYRISKEGNFEGKIHLTRMLKQSANEPAEQQWKRKLLDERNKRTRPGLDDKSITAWNALMLKGYVDAYIAFGNETYLHAALKNGDFILTHQWAEGVGLFRNYKNGKSTIKGFLDDYAFTIDAFLSLFEVTFHEKWLKLALKMTRYCLENFYDEEKKVFYYTDKTGEKLIARKIENSDNVIPASNSAMGKNLYKIGLLTEEETYRTIAEKMTLRTKESILRHTSFYANWAILMRWITHEPYVISIAADTPQKVRLQFGQHYLPTSFFIAGQSQLIPSLKEKLSSGQNAIYVCRHKSCGLPAHNVDEALKQIFG
jgi:uncharacterized protein YyaL (SSP411 family)